jgi:ABC-type glycerol-3-phosphate transport system substrate-binding protein
MVAAGAAGAIALAPVLERPTLRIAIHEGVEGVALKALARDFSVRNRVAVELFELPYAALYEAEMDAVRGEGDPFDVIMVDDPWLPALIGGDRDGEATRLEPFRFDERACAQFRLGDFVPSTLRVSLHPAHPDATAAPGGQGGRPPIACNGPDTRLYALPFVGNSQLFLTRPGLQPRTWAEVAALTETAADAGYVTRVGAGNSIVTDFMPILWTLSPPVREAPHALASFGGATPGRMLFDREQTVAAFGFVRSLGALPNANRGVISVDDFDLAIHLVQERASMMIAWSAWVMAIAKLPRPPGTEPLDLYGRGRPAFDVLPVPGDQPVLGAWLLAVPARAAEKTLARAFALFATEKDQIDRAAELGNPPPRISTLTDSRWADVYPFFPQQLDSLQRARPRPRTIHWRRIETILGDCLTALYESTIAPDQAWARMQDGLVHVEEGGDLSCQRASARAADGVP